MRCILAFLLLLQAVKLSGQPSPDSLWTIWLDERKADTTRLRALQDFAWTKMYSDPDSAAMLAKMELDYAVSIGNQTWQGKAHNTMGGTFHVKGEYAAALNHYQKSLSLLQEAGEVKPAASLYNNIGLIFREQGNASQALVYYQKYLDIGLQLQDKDLLSSAYNNLGTLYSDQNNYSLALEYYKKGLAFAIEIEDVYGQALAYNNIGSVYYNQKIYEKALEEYYKSLELRQKINDQRGIALMYNNIGLVLQGKKGYQDAYRYFEKSQAIQHKLGDKPSLASTYYSLGTLFNDQNKFREAIRWCSKGLETSEAIGALRQARNACNCLYEAHKGLGNSETALKWYERFSTLNDSLHKEETDQRLGQMEFAKQVLTDSLGREEEKLKMEVAHREEVRKKDRLTKVLLIIGLVMLTVAIAVWSRMLYFRKYSQHYENKAQSLEKQQLINEIALLKTQVNPHFLFNSLSILASLVHVDPVLSEQFIDQLSKSYRYILEQKEQSLVTLRTELEFIRSYAFLLKIRFENKFDLQIRLPENLLDKYRIAPLTLQLLVENAVKHNRMSAKEPLVVEVFEENEYLIVRNKLQLRPQRVESTGTGLNNIINRYALLTDRPVWAGERENEFVVKVPLLSA